MKTPERKTLEIMALAIRIGLGYDQTGKLQKRLNRKLSEMTKPVVAVRMNPWARNERPHLP